MTFVWLPPSAPCCSLGLSSRTGQQPSASNLIDYWTDGADIERSGWIKNEKILTKANVGTLKLKWKLETGNQPRALHSLMPVLVIGQLSTAGGVKQVGIVNGISDNLYAFDVETGKILWQKHWDYQAPAGRRGGGGAAPQDPRRLGFLQPGGSSDTPVIGPRRAGAPPGLLRDRRRDAAHPQCGRRHDLQPPSKFYGGKGWALNLVGNTLWMQTTYGGASIAAVRVDDPEHKVMTWNAGSGGAWGRRGVAVDSNGTAWTTTGDGVYDRDQRSAALRQQRRRRAHPERRAEAEGLLHADQLGLAAQARPRSEQHADGLQVQGARADRRVGQGMPPLPARSGVGRRREPPDARLQDPALLQRGSRLPGHGQLGRARAPGRIRAARAGCWRRSGGRCTRRPSSRLVRAGEGRRRRGLQAGRARRQARVRAGLGLARHEARRAGADRQRHGGRLRQRRGDQAGVARHRPAVRFVDPRREGHARHHLRARRDHRQGAVVERRADAPVESLLRRHRRQWPYLPGHLRRHAVLLRRRRAGAGGQEQKAPWSTNAAASL